MSQESSGDTILPKSIGRGLAQGQQEPKSGGPCDHWLVSTNQSKAYQREQIITKRFNCEAINLHTYNQLLIDIKVLALMRFLTQALTLA